jgi:hypothetical protein
VKIAIIGAGSVGGTLGQAWAAKGHDIVFGMRHPGDEKIKTLVQATGGKARAMSIRDAVVGTDVVVLATPWAGGRETVEAAGEPDRQGSRGCHERAPIGPVRACGRPHDLGRRRSGPLNAGGEGGQVVKAFNLR